MDGVAKHSKHYQYFLSKLMESIIYIVVSEFFHSLLKFKISVEIKKLKTIV